MAVALRPPRSRLAQAPRADVEMQMVVVGAIVVGTQHHLEDVAGAARRVAHEAPP